MMNQKTIIFRIFMLVLFVSAAMVHDPAAAKGRHQVRKEAFGKTGDGRPVALYTLTNSNGMEVRTMTYGGIIVSIRVPDKNGKMGDVVLGHENVDGYLEIPRISAPSWADTPIASPAAPSLSTVRIHAAQE